MQLKTIITVSLASMLLFSGGTALAINVHPVCYSPVKKGKAKVFSPGNTYQCLNVGEWKMKPLEILNFVLQCQIICKNDATPTLQSYSITRASSKVFCTHDPTKAKCQNHSFDVHHLSVDMTCACPSGKITSKIGGKTVQDLNFLNQLRNK